MLPYLTGEIKESKVLHPVVIVHQFGFVRTSLSKSKELSQLFLDASHIVTQCFFSQQLRSCDLPEGSPIIPVAPPTNANGL